MIRTLVIGFGIVVSVKFLLNAYYLMKAKHLIDDYANWIKGKGVVAISQKKAEFIFLTKRANVKDHRFPIVENLGYGQLTSFEGSTRTNFPSNDPRFIQGTVGMLNEAIGTFRSRMMSSINPIYWIDLIVFLPSRALESIGVKSENAGLKILNVLWWILAPIAIALRDKLYLLVIQLFR